MNVPTITAANIAGDLPTMSSNVLEKKDATGTHIGILGVRDTVSAMFVRVLTVAPIVLPNAQSALIMMIHIMKTTAMENVNGVVLGYGGIVSVSLNE